MRVAVCTAGCLRSWKSVFHLHTEFFQEVLPRLLEQSVEVDWFYFIWNFNSISPCFVQSKLDGKRNELFTELTIPLSDTELYDFRDRCLNERSGVQEFKVGTVVESFEARNRYGEVLHADGSQQYGKSKVSGMRLAYEKEHGFEYDIVFGSRFDLQFNIYRLLVGAGDIIPEEGVIKSGGRSGEISDIFYWAKSKDFTIMENQFNFATSEEGKEYYQDMEGCFPEHRKRHYLENYCKFRIDGCNSIREEDVTDGVEVILNVDHARQLWEQLNRGVSLNRCNKIRIV